MGASASSSAISSSDGKNAAPASAGPVQHVECGPNAAAEAATREPDDCASSSSLCAVKNPVLLGKRKGVEWIEIPDDD